MAATADRQGRTFSSLAWHFLWPLLILGALNLLWGDVIGPRAEAQFGDRTIYARNCFHASDAWYLLVCEGNAELGAARAVQRTLGENRSPYRDLCEQDPATFEIRCRETPGVRSFYAGPLAVLNIPALILAAPTISSYTYLEGAFTGTRENAETIRIVLSALVLALWSLWFLAAVKHLFRRRRS